MHFYLCNPKVKSHDLFNNYYFPKFTTFIALLCFSFDTIFRYSLLSLTTTINLNDDAWCTWYIYDVCSINWILIVISFLISFQYRINFRLIHFSVSKQRANSKRFSVNVQQNWTLTTDHWTLNMLSMFIVDHRYFITENPFIHIDSDIRVNNMILLLLSMKFHLYYYQFIQSNICITEIVYMVSFNTLTFT